MNLDEREIARYLGIFGEIPPETAKLARQCQEELMRIAAPKTVGRRLSADLYTGESQELQVLLRHCREVYLFAVTLGPACDRLLRRWSVQSMAKAAVGQAVCVVRLDELVAEVCAGLPLKDGEYLTVPFSPGYGDWDLTAQKTILGQLDAHLRIGLTCTDGGMLVPEKSVTVLVGISDRREDLCLQKCMRCKKMNCPYRTPKNDGHEGDDL